MNTIKEHLVERGLDISRNDVVIDEVHSVVTFYLYNLTGQLVGFQQYNPHAAKVNGTKAKRMKSRTSGDARARDMMRYFTFMGDEGCAKRIGVWGVDTLDRRPYTFMTEGIFDAVKVHNAGHPCIAVLTNNPRHIKSWLLSLGRKLIVVNDNDVAGTRLSYASDFSRNVGDPWKDLGKMSQDDATCFIDETYRQFIEHEHTSRW